MVNQKGFCFIGVGSINSLSTGPSGCAKLSKGDSWQSLSLSSFFRYSTAKRPFLLQAVRRVKWHLRARRLVREPQMGMPCRRSGNQTGCGSVIRGNLRPDLVIFAAHCNRTNEDISKSDACGRK